MDNYIYWVSTLGYAVLALTILLKERKYGLRIMKDNVAVTFLLATSLAFYLSDTLWGMCTFGIIRNDTVYFVASSLFHSLGILVAFAWLYYILIYIKCPKRYFYPIIWLDSMLVAVDTVLVFANFFTPLLFTVKDGVYNREALGLYLFINQHMVFIGSAIISFCALLFRRSKRTVHTKHLAVFCASSMPIILGAVQLIQPNGPYVSMGFALSTTLLYTFVISADREELHLSKVTFLRNMSHEIRTSLNSVYGFAQLLGMPEHTWSEEEREQYNEYMHNNYNMLNLLLNDLMSYTRFEKKDYKINIGQVDVAKTCQNAVQTFEGCKPVALNVRIVSELPENMKIENDALRIQQILLNLLTNASQYTEQGEITLHTSLSDEGLELAVESPNVSFSNSKPLISDNQSDEEDATELLGLRISVCRIIAKLLGGRVYLDKTYRQGERIVFVINHIYQ